MKPNWCLYWDGYGLGSPNSGIFVHGFNLAAELCALGVEPHLIGDTRTLAHFPFLPGSFIQPPPWTSWLPDNKLFWHHGVTRAIEARSRDQTQPLIVHGLSNFNIPLRSKLAWRRVLTVHDLIPLLLPRDVSRAQYLQVRTLVPRALAVADRIVCVSNWTKQTILEFMPEVAEKIRVIPNGLIRSAIDPHLRPPSQGKIRLLFVARFEKYKGHQILVDLLSKSGLPLSLDVITDSRGLEFWTKCCPGEIARGSVSVRTNVYGKDLAAAYSMADVYVSPSLYEGFCLPAVEALCAGVPVVYRSGSGIDEVAGRSVSIAVEQPDSIPDWERAIAEAIQVRSGAHFAELLNNHLESLPTWKEGASQLLSLYNELV